MLLPVESVTFWLLAITGVVLTGISKSGFAGGAGVVAVPLLAMQLSVTQATALMLPLLLMMDAGTIRYYRQHLNVHELKRIVPSALVGIAIGGLLLGTLSDSILQVLLGILSLLFASWARLAPLFSRIRGAAWGWGSVSGITSTLIHAGGPPINIYFIGRELEKLTWLATAGAFFGIMNLVKIVPYTLNHQWQWNLLIVALLLTPAAWLGLKLGHVIQHRIDERVFMRVCKVLLFCSGLALLAKPLTVVLIA